MHNGGKQLAVHLHNNLKRTCSRNIAFWNILKEERTDKFDKRQCQIKVKVNVGLQNCWTFNIMRTVKSCYSILVPGRHFLLGSIYNFKYFHA